MWVSVIFWTQCSQDTRKKYIATLIKLLNKFVYFFPPPKNCSLTSLQFSSTLTLCEFSGILDWSVQFTYKVWWRWRFDAALKAEFAIFHVGKLLHSLQCLLWLACWHYGCSVPLDPSITILTATFTIQLAFCHTHKIMVILRSPK